MPAPTRPAQDAIIDPVWGQWVHDHQITPRRFHVWRTTDLSAGLTDGYNVIPWDGKDDPLGMINAQSEFVAPTAGLVAFGGTIGMSWGGSVPPSTLCALFEDNVEARRGIQLTSGTPLASVNIGLHLSVPAFPVKAGSKYRFTPYVSAPSQVKNIAGGKAITWFEGVYLTGPT